MKHITIRYNEEDLLIHEWLKDFFGLRDQHGEEAQTIKSAERAAFNVLRAMFGDNLKDIFKRIGRDELIAIRAIQKEKIKQSNTLTRANIPKSNTKNINIPI